MLSLRGHWGLGRPSAGTGRPVSTLGGLHSSCLSPSGLRELGGCGRQRLPSAITYHVPGWAQGWGWSREHGILLGLRDEVTAALF